MTAHGGGDSRVLEDLPFLMMAVVGVELECGASRLILLTSNGSSGLLVGTVLGGESSDTTSICITLGMTVLADANTVDTGGVSHLDQLSADAIGHVILSDSSRGDSPVAGTHSLGATREESSAGHGHILELGLLARATVCEDEAGATVLVLLPETNVDGLLSLTEGACAVEDALVKGLLGLGTLCALGSVGTEGNCGTLVVLHHALCAVLVVLHEDLGSARGLVASGDGIVTSAGGGGGVV